MLWASKNTPTPDQLLELGDVIYLRDLDNNLLQSLSDIQKDTDLFALAIRLIDLCQKHNLICVEPDGTKAFQNTLGKVAEMYADGDIIFMYSQVNNVFIHECFIKV